MTFLELSKGVTENTISDVQIGIEFSKLSEEKQNYLVVAEMSVGIIDKVSTDKIAEKIKTRYDLPFERYQYIVENCNRLNKELVGFIHESISNLALYFRVSSGEEMTPYIKDKINSDKDLLDYILEQEDYETLEKLK